MRCNLFKPLACNTGEFLTFEQYTDDLTKEQACKNTYRVVPSKFVAINVDLSKVFSLDNPSMYVRPTSNNPSSNSMQDRLCVFPNTEHEVKGYNNIISQIFQSAYENAVTTLRNTNPEYFTLTDKEYSRYILWTVLKDAKFLTEQHRMIANRDMVYWDELKYIGDINFHSDVDIDNYNYSEIYCHIPSSHHDRFYAVESAGINPLQFPDQEQRPNYGYNSRIEGWDDNTYPDNYPLAGYAMTPSQDSVYGHYRIEDKDLHSFVLGSNEVFDGDGIDRDGSTEFQFNTIILFYDVYNNSDPENHQLLHSNRPMGIYFTGPIGTKDSGAPDNFRNVFTKYITNNDAYGQGAAFGLRLLTRAVPTPNSSSYEISIATDNNDNEYHSVATALGRISDAIIDANRSFKTMEEMAQQYKDHLAIFENNRTNVPYARKVDGQYYWFVNGRNTGQLCTAQGGPDSSSYSTSPTWRITDTEPEIIYNAQGVQSGWARVEKEDINPYSPTYGMIRKFIKYNEAMWGPGERPEPDWRPTMNEINEEGTQAGVYHQFIRVMRPYYDGDINQPLYLSSGYYNFIQTDEQAGSPTSGQTRLSSGFNIHWQNYSPAQSFDMSQGVIDWEHGQRNILPEEQYGEHVYIQDSENFYTGEYVQGVTDTNPFSTTYSKYWEVHGFDPSKKDVKTYPVNLLSAQLNQAYSTVIIYYEGDRENPVWTNEDDSSVTDSKELCINRGAIMNMLVKPKQEYTFRRIAIGSDMDDPSYDYNDVYTDNNDEESGIGPCRKLRMIIPGTTNIRILFNSPQEHYYYVTAMYGEGIARMTFNGNEVAPTSSAQYLEGTNITAEVVVGSNYQNPKWYTKEGEQSDWTYQQDGTQYEFVVRNNMSVKCEVQPLL